MGSYGMICNIKIDQNKSIVAKRIFFTSKINIKSLKSLIYPNIK